MPVSPTLPELASPTARFTPPTERYAGYIFDCDGTLVETMPLHHRAWKSALAQAGAGFDFSWELFNQRAGMTLEQTVVELNAQFGARLEAERVAKVQRQVYRELLGDVRPIDCVVQYARRVRRHAPVAVASGGRHAEVTTSLRNARLLDLFDPIVTSSDVRHGKPDPEMLLLCAQRMGVAPADCLVVEDGALGIEAAERAGMRWVRVAPHPA